MRFAKSGMVALLAALMLALPLAVLAGETLDAVKARGYLIVGVNGGLYGFGMPDDKGVWRGLDVDTGRAIATAIFGDPDKIKFVTLTTQTQVYRTPVQRGRRSVPQRHEDTHPRD